MAQLKNAPLIEVILELRWGKIDPNTQEPSFPYHEVLLPGKYDTEISKLGYEYKEYPNPPYVAPQVPIIRFRKDKNQWPCYQLGTGIFTVNQINDGYSWSNFKENIIQGLKILDQIYPNGLKNLPDLTIDLRYVDGLLLKEGQSPMEFLEKNLNVKLLFSSNDFLKDSQVFESQTHADDLRLSFKIKSVYPNKDVFVNIQQGLINGNRGFFMNTSVRFNTNGSSIDTYVTDIEEAHSIQESWFELLIRPHYMEELQ